MKKQIKKEVQIWFIALRVDGREIEIYEYWSRKSMITAADFLKKKKDVEILCVWCETKKEKK